MGGARPYWWARTAEAALTDDARCSRRWRASRATWSTPRVWIPGNPSRAATTTASASPPSRWRCPTGTLAAPAVAAGAAYHAAHVALVEDTLATLAGAVPDMFDAFRRIIRVDRSQAARHGRVRRLQQSRVAGIVRGQRAAGTRPCSPTTSCTSCSTTSCRSSRSSVALFDTRPQPSGRCYSPWRDDRRSPYGVFHGVYVFLGVHQYWQRIDAQELGDDRGAYRCDQVGAHPAAAGPGRGRARATRRPHTVRRAILAELSLAVEQLRAEVTSTPATSPRSSRGKPRADSDASGTRRWSAPLGARRGRRTPRSPRMIFVATTADNDHAMAWYLLREGAPFRRTIVPVTYDDLLAAPALPRATYVFADVELVADDQRARRPRSGTGSPRRATACSTTRRARCGGTTCCANSTTPAATASPCTGPPMTCRRCASRCSCATSSTTRGARRPARRR